MSDLRERHTAPAAKRWILSTAKPQIECSPQRAELSTGASTAISPITPTGALTRRPFVDQLSQGLLLVRCRHHRSYQLVHQECYPRFVESPQRSSTACSQYSIGRLQLQHDVHWNNKSSCRRSPTRRVAPQWPSVSATYNHGSRNAHIRYRLSARILCTQMSNSG